MDQNNPFFKQVQLLVAILPTVARYECFALKGGTAINLYVRDMPRLSVDIDLTYLPLNDRDTALAEIEKTLAGITGSLRSISSDFRIRRAILKGTGRDIKLFVERGNTGIKIEVSPILRGCVLPPTTRSIQPQATEYFGEADVTCLNYHEIYAGKLCAALDRQHPRDLFDVKILLENEGLTEQLISVFIVYLLSSNRPIAEMLNPGKLDLKDLYETQFEAMTLIDVDLASLIETRERMLEELHAKMTDEKKHFLLAFKKGDVNWDTFEFPAAKELPGIKWKIYNLHRMDKNKRMQAIEKLEHVLYR